MHIIIGMPPQTIIIGVPIAIMAFMALHRSAITSMPMPSMGMSLHVIPSLVISSVQRAIIGIGIIMGMPIPCIIAPIEPPMGIMPAPMGMPIGIGIMAGIPIGIGIIVGMGIMLGMDIGIELIGVMATPFDCT
jgi:hypothetical protein